MRKPGEMAAILNNLQEGDVLFVDEIHRLNRQVEEVLYPAMEDFAIDIMIGKGATCQVDPSGSAAFYTGRGNHPCRNADGSAPGSFRGGAPIWNFIRKKNCRPLSSVQQACLDVEIDEEGSHLRLARRSRGTPRLANRLLKRVRDFAQVKYDGGDHRRGGKVMHWIF